MESLSLPLHKSLDYLTAAFRTAGEELYLVGGAVRDSLLDVPSDEFDFATSARPDRTLEILAQLGEGNAYRAGERFGTIGWFIDGHVAEITTYRAEEHYEPLSRKPHVRFGSTLLEDLSRRDFTINAVALDPATGQVIDPLNGVEDLRGRRLRAVGHPEDRFDEDPLRLLRAIRFASRLCLTIETDTWEGIKRTAPSLRNISRERIRDEFTKMLLDVHVVRAMELLRDSDLLTHSVPELVNLTLMPDHGPRHPLSLWDHVMNVLERVEPRLELRWAALLHDIAKPLTRTEEPVTRRPRFFHHEEIGAGMARDVLSGLRYNNQVVEAVALLVETHMQLHAYSPDWSDGAVRRLILRMGPCLDDALALARADAAGHDVAGIGHWPKRYDELEMRIRRLESEPAASLSSPLTGDDLMKRYGRPPGPWIKGIKDALLEEVLEGRLRPEDRARAWELADALVAGSQ